MNKLASQGKERRSRQPPQGYSRWPAVCSAQPDGASSLIEETDRLPIPFLSRELRVTQEEWLQFLRQHPRFSRQDANLGRGSTGKRFSKPSSSQDSVSDADVEALDAVSRPGQLTYKRGAFGHFPIQPVSKPAIMWKFLVTLVDATYSAFLIPISCAFHWNVRNFSWYNGLDAAAGVVFWVDILMGFITGFVIVYNLKRMVVTSPKLIAWFYIFRGGFLLDLLAALPIIAEVAVLCIPKTGGQVSLHVIFLMRLTRMYRVFKMLEWLIKVSLAGHVNKRLSRIVSAGQMFLITLLYAALVFLNLLSCFWYYVATWEGLQHSWLTSVGPNARDISGLGPVRHYIAALFFVVTTVTTVGYGDISPVSAAEEICAVVIMLIGVVFFGVIIAGSQELVQYLAPEARSLSLLRSKMEQVEIWAGKRQISPMLRSKCNSYFTEVWLRDAELHRSTVFAELPAALQAAVCQELTEQAFRNSDVFNVNLPLLPAAEVVDDKCMSLIMTRLKPVLVAAGHDLCQEGAKADCLWIIEEGEILSIRHGTELELLEAPAIVGETAILAGTIPMCRKRLYTLRAVSPCMLWTFEEMDMQHMLELYPDLMERLLRSFRNHLQSLMVQNKHLFHEEGWSDVMEHIEKDGSLNKEKTNGSQPEQPD